MSHRADTLKQPSVTGCLHTVIGVTSCSGNSVRDGSQAFYVSIDKILNRRPGVKSLRINIDHLDEDTQIELDDAALTVELVGEYNQAFQFGLSA